MSHSRKHGAPQRVAAYAESKGGSPNGEGVDATAPQTSYVLGWRNVPTVILDNPCDLAPLASELADGEALAVAFRRGESSGPGELSLEITSRGLAPSATGDPSLRPSPRALEAAVRAAFPGSIPVYMPTSGSQRESAIELVSQHALPVHVDRGVNDRGPDSSAAHGPGRPCAGILLPASARSAAALGDCLSVLMSARRPFTLRVTVEPVTLAGDDRQRVAAVAGTLKADADLLLRDPIAFHAALHSRQLLSAWVMSGRGWRIRWSLDLPGNLGDRLFLARLLSARVGNAEAQDTASAGTLDLSQTMPRALGLAGVLPTIGELRWLGFLSRQGSATDQQEAGTDDLILGRDADGDLIAVPRLDLGRHMLILGATGTGKSTLVRQLVTQDIALGRAGIVIDPHGDLVADIHAGLSPEQRARVDLFDLDADPASLGLDLLGGTGPDPETAAHRAASDLTDIFQRVLFADSPEAFGPMWGAYFRNALVLLIRGQAARGERASLCDFDRVFHDASFRKCLLSACPDPAVVRFWNGVALRAGGEASLENLTPYIVAKIEALTANPAIRAIVAGVGTPLDLGASFSAGRMILVNLAKGSLGGADAALIGALITARVLRDLLARCRLPKSQRPPARVVIDEFQTIATHSLAQLMSEGRKSGAEIVCCSQDLTSFGGSRPQPQVAAAILANAAHLVAFRLGPRDAALLADWFQPGYGPADLMRLPDRSFLARVLAHGVPQELRVGHTLEERLLA